AGDDLGGVGDSLVHRIRGASSDRVFVAGFVAELRALLLSESDGVRRLATRLAGALLARRRATVQDLLGEELLSTGFSMLEHPLAVAAAAGESGGRAGPACYSVDPASEEEASAE
ncbi:unnamed protein product, partial [Scytosiphon promiscuus]